MQLRSNIPFRDARARSVLLRDLRCVATFDVSSSLKSWRDISNCIVHSCLSLCLLSLEGRKHIVRWRVVYQRIGMHLSFEAIARHLNIATSTAHRIYSLFDRTGSVDPQTSKHKEYRRVLGPVNEVFVLGIILENPSMYLYEVCEEISDSLQISVSPSSICRLWNYS